VHERRHGAGYKGGQGRAGEVQEELSHAPDVPGQNAGHHKGRSKVVCSRAGGQARRYILHRLEDDAFFMDKIVEFERTDKSRRNPTIAEATLAEEDGAIIKAVKANKKKGKGKGKGKGRATLRTRMSLPPMSLPAQGRPRTNTNSATRPGTSRLSATRSRTWRNSNTRWSAKSPPRGSQRSQKRSLVMGDV
jgi:hypothetical protein